jgi:DNA repair exonuclease SbcCD ATPase subunit/DNA repair exonuclease SbcCD nuclease subunit
MSPEMVEVTSRFLSNIADIAPTILIAGNHDCNLANTNRLDALTPIVNNLKHPNLHYVRESATVQVADTAFAVCSIFDEQEQWPVASGIDDVYTKIALYHGPVHGATTDANFTITNRHIHVNTFAGYDMVMLGDIHKHQILQENNPIIVYASSLLQQNHGESVDGHGWCLWDVPSRTFEFVPLENDYGYVTFEVVNGNILHPAKIPSKIRMRLFTGDLDATEVKKLITSLRKKYNITELSVNKNRINKVIDRESITTDSTSLDPTNISVQHKLIFDWLERNYSTLDDQILTSIENINKDMNSRIQLEDHSRNIHWRPINFKFSNMFSYGENNEIDFDEMNGVYGIFAPNASGKSSIMDALMFCLYDKTPRAFKGDHIINNRKDSFECELTFEINDERFGIKRVGSRKKNGDVKVDVEFWKMDDDSNIISLNGESRRDTNANIRSYVGTYEDFVMTTLSGQTSNALFIDKSHSERKDLLIQFMGLNVFDKLFNAAHDESKEIAGVLKRFKKSDVTDQIASTHDLLIETQSRYDATQTEYQELHEARRALDAQVLYWQGKKKPVAISTTDITSLRATLSTSQELLATAEQSFVHITEKYDISEQEYARSIEDFATYDMVKLGEAIVQYNTLNDALVKANNTLRVLTTKIEEKDKFKNKLQGYKYNPDCEVCITNNASVINDLRIVDGELAELNANRVAQEASIAKIIEDIEPLKSIKETYDAAMKLQSTIETLSQKQNRLKVEKDAALVQIEKTQNKIAQISTDIETYLNNEETILHNLDVDNRLSEIQQKIDANNQSVQSLDKILRELHGNVSVLEAKKQELMDRLKEAEHLETTYEAFNHYMLAIGRDGIPYELMGRAIPNIEAEINNILSQIVDFTISLDMDGKNINGKLTYDYDRVWPLENSSGMERFVSSLAIRVALLNASNLPKSNFMIIDEGFGVLDAEHLHSMQTLFNLLKTHFDFILIVSHLDSARDMVDSIIEIHKEDGYSQISV